MTYRPFPALADWDAGFDPTVVDEYAALLEQARAAATPEARRRALEVATRYAAVDTGAIEGLYTTDRGFTRTIATQGEFWERALSERGEQVRRSIQDALNAYDHVLDAATGSVPLTAKWVRELHSIITEHQPGFTVHILVGDRVRTEERPLPKGEYKRLPNNPTNKATGIVHDYAPPEDASAEVARLFDELATPAFQAAHPVVQAAYAHYAFICVHPFTDGNGRVARALASVFLYRRPGVPLVVFADQREAYLDALEAADAGRPGPFTDFIAERVIDTVTLVAQPLVELTDATSAVAELAGHAARADALAAAGRLGAMCWSHLKRAVAELGLPEQVGLAFGTAPGTRDLAIPAGYRAVSDDAALASASLGGKESSVRFVVATGDLANRPEFFVAGSASSVEVWLREVHPMELATLRLKLDTWARASAHALIVALNGALTESAP
jgi:Fic family protein